MKFIKMSAPQKVTQDISWFIEAMSDIKPSETLDGNKKLNLCARYISEGQFARFLRSFRYPAPLFL